MRPLSAIGPWLLCLLLSPAGARAQSPGKYEGKCTNAACHGAYSQRKVVHAPVTEDACDACHEPVPGADHKFRLAREGPALCAECHDDLTEDLPHVHGPVAVGACTACHQPHGSDHAHLLTGEEKELCVQCHTAIRETTAAAAHVHRPVGEGCLACHAAHGAKNKRMLTSEPPELCLDCHTEIAEALSEGDPRPHGPVKNGECETCHEPHASSRAHLLARDYPPNFYAPFDEKGYGLCFECHEPEAFTEKETDEATGFRDGKRNLHYLHVNRTVKGRTCRACHDPHASKNGKHIVDRVPFGTWRIPLNFKETPTGGSCQPGCHRPQQYDRDQPRNSEK